MKKTLVLGASLNPSRFSHMAVCSLAGAGHPVVAVGRQAGSVCGIEIVTGKPEVEGVHTVSLYLGSANQSGYIEYLLDEVKPSRIIFNPGAENETLKKAAAKKNIETVEGCTLNMLAMDVY